MEVSVGHPAEYLRLCWKFPAYAIKRRGRLVVWFSSNPVKFRCEVQINDVHVKVHREFHKSTVEVKTIFCQM